jgi:ferredoxin--NADP+ reductase
VPPLSVAVVGSGPSGAYCTQLLCEDDTLDARVDVYERLPAPFGLVRYGVAPDHLQIKSIAATLADIYTHPRVRFLGNVGIGSDVALGELRTHYDAVIVACGASVDRRLGIPDEDLAGVLSATDFVTWYCGHPDAAVDRFTLSAERAVIVGVGNVALDVARMLVLTPDELRATDVPEHVVDVLSESSVREICIVGRRSPRFAKFTNKDLAELGQGLDADIVADAGDLAHDAARYGEVEAPATRRLLATLADFAARPQLGRRRRIGFRFGLSPARILGGDEVERIRFEPFEHPAADPIDMDAQLVLRSIGYRGTPLPGLAFDSETGTVPNHLGRVLDGGAPVAGLYTVGWIKRGPSGVIGTNRKDATETVAALAADLAAGRTASHSGSADELVERLDGRGTVVGWDGWRNIELAEAALGATLGRGPVKLHDRAQLLRAAGICA